MNEVANPAKGVIPASTLLLLVMTIGGIMLHEQPFKPARPSEHGVEGIETSIESRVHIPQWEDPFKETTHEFQDLGQVEGTAHAMCKSGIGHLPALKTEISAWDRHDDPWKIQLLLVLTSSGFTHNAVELRRRQRMALALAMVESGFAPQTPGELGYVTFPSLQLAATGLTEGGHTVLMPYEWFRKAEETGERSTTASMSASEQPRARSGRQMNLVLWLQSEDVLGEPGIGTLSLEVIVNSIVDPGLKDRAQVKIIGPGSSDELFSLLSDPEFLLSDPGYMKDQEDDSQLYQQAQRLKKIRDSELQKIVTVPWGASMCVVEESPAQPSGGPQAPVLSRRASCDHEEFEKFSADLDQAGAYVEDSDPTWADTLSSLFINGYCTARPAGQEDSVKESAQDTELREYAQQLLETGEQASDLGIFTDITMEYLDVEPSGEEKKIDACIATSFESDSHEEEPSLRDCLKMLNIQDSDVSWYDTVAQFVDSRRYVVSQSRIYSGAEPGDSPEALAARDHAAFVLLADSYLDDGWPESWAALQLPAPTTQPTSVVHDIRRFSNWNIYSPRATVSQAELFAAAPSFENVHRTIADDFTVTRMLVLELFERGVRLCSPESRIDLVLEGDSIYGKKYKKTFQEAARRICRERELDEGLVRIEDHYFFSHAEGEHAAPRGRDSHGSSAALSLGGATSLVSSGGTTLELPTGAHQLDYIRRLAKTVSRPSEGISAIGIIGSDVYDKQLIIEALRTYLPGTLIFTTDADALYEHPSFYRFNQNLLVASAYGLTLDDHSVFPTDIEFRDNYQSSFYVAVRAAQQSFRGLRNDQNVKLFEVGRSGLIDITPAENWGRPAVETESLLLKFSMLLAPIVILQLSLLSSRRHVPVESQPHRKRRRALNGLLALGVAVFIASLIGLLVWAWRPGFEPFYVLEGISAAPTVMFRVSAALFAITLMVFIGVRIKSNQDELKKYFGLGAGPAPAADGRGRAEGSPRVSITRWEIKLAAMISRSHRSQASDWKPPTASAVWSEYQALGRYWSRFRRVLIPFLVILGLVYWIAFGLYEQPHLIRWNTFLTFPFLDWEVNGFELMTFVSVVCSSLAVLLAGDALRLCTVFVRWQEYDFVNWQSLPGRSVYRHLNDYAADRLASVEIIMRRTEVMRQIIILPFIVLFLQIVARSNLFEGWTWNPGIVSIYTGFAVYLFFRSSRLQQAANSARRNVLVDLEREASNLRMRIAGGDSAAVKKASSDRRQLTCIEEVIRHITELKRGLFRPVLDHPLFQAIAWPSTGLGILALMQLLLT